MVHAMLQSSGRGVSLLRHINDHSHHYSVLVWVGVFQQIFAVIGLVNCLWLHSAPIDADAPMANIGVSIVSGLTIALVFYHGQAFIRFSRLKFNIPKITK